MQLGREVMGAKNAPVWAMPRMEKFLRENGPWSQLVHLQNIDLQPLRADSTVQLTADLRITPFLVPHRDEFSETVGYSIETPRKKVILSRTSTSGKNGRATSFHEVRTVDYALLDATFFKDGELAGPRHERSAAPVCSRNHAAFRAGTGRRKKESDVYSFQPHQPDVLGQKSSKRSVEAGFSIAEEGMVIGL